MIRSILFIVCLSVFRAYSQELPEWNSEYKRWHVPADDWSAFTDGNYTMKYRYLQISLSDLTLSLKFHETEKLNKLMFEVRNLNLSVNSAPVCRMQSMPEIYGSNLTECKYFNCQKTQVSKKFVAPYITQDFKNFNETLECPIKPNIILSSEDGKEYYNIPISGKLDNWNYLKVKDQAKNTFSFLDLSFCKTDKSLCREVYVKESQLEASIRNINERKKQKDLYQILELKQNLDSCLKSQDFNCIRQYFVTESEFHSTSNDYVIPKTVKFNEITFDKKLINELFACLDHDKLLIASPTMIVTKGIYKVCVISMLNHKIPPKGKAKLLTVIYPEGVRSESDRSIWVRE